MLSAMAGGFAKNNHSETLGGIIADNVVWDWSDGTRGEGPKEELFGIFSKTWGFMVSSFLYSGVRTVVDTDASKVVISFDLTINIDGGLPEANLVQNSITFIMTISEGKATKWEGYWNQQNANLQAAMAKVMAKLSEAAPADA
jgi:hypothetical protein